MNCNDEGFEPMLNFFKFKLDSYEQEQREWQEQAELMALKVDQVHQQEYETL